MSPDNADPRAADVGTRRPPGPAEEVIRIRDHYYILATSSRADERTRVLKHGETFAIFDHVGDIAPFGLGEQGLYHEGTRFLSRLELRLADARPLLLSSAVRENNDLFVVDLTNPDIPVADGDVFPRDILHIFRSKFLWQGTCYERLRVSNHGLVPATLSIRLRFDADFADIFEVRGTRRGRRGRRLANEVVPPGTLLLGYEGLDGIKRRARIKCSPKPAAIRSDDQEIVYELTLPPQTSELLFFGISCEVGGLQRVAVPYDQALAAARDSRARARAGHCTVVTSNEQFNDWINRSMADLHMMVTDTAEGPYPYAGVPWFSTVFGRDGIITAYELLWTFPGLARGVLAHLAETQAKEVDADRDAEPGKVLHEARLGEMAALREIPFGRYYGSVDATPLFVLLAGAYFERTGDRSFLESIWEDIELALEWMETYGDPDRDGFVEYLRRTPEGLVQQGWKDSQDSVFHEDGTPAEGPIALCEVQAYVYAARRRIAEVAAALGRPATAARLEQQAAALRERFEQAFWCQELGTYALALDGRKRQCRVRSSNAGHALFGGIARPDRARLVAAQLLGDQAFSGWGIRTISANERRYNPMSYHNGSVWPHDNALIAAGLARYGFTADAIKVLRGMFDVSLFVDLHRLPELFCGFHRRPGEGPTLYPVACAPQSWAAAAVFLLIQSCLNLTIAAPANEVRLVRPLLPEFLERVTVNNLMAGDGSVDLVFERHELDVGIKVMRREGDVQIVVVK